MKKFNFMIGAIILLLLAGVIVFAVLYGESESGENKKVIDFMMQQAKANEIIGPVITKDTNQVSSTPATPIIIHSSPKTPSNKERSIVINTNIPPYGETSKFSIENGKNGIEASIQENKNLKNNHVSIKEFDRIVKNREHATPSFGFRRLIPHLFQKSKLVVDKENEERLFECVCIDSNHCEKFKKWFPGEEVKGLRNERNSKFLPWVQLALMMRKIFQDYPAPTRPFLILLEEKDISESVWKRRRSDLISIKNTRFDILTRYQDRKNTIHSDHDLWFIVHPDSMSTLYYITFRYLDKRQSYNFYESTVMNLNFVRDSNMQIEDITSTTVRVARQKGKKIGILLIATGKYHRFLDNIMSAFRKYFCRPHFLHFYVWTDFGLNSSSDVTVFNIKCQGFPMDTLLRYEYFSSQRSNLEDEDVLIYCDVDFTIVNTHKYVDSTLFAPDRQSPYLVALPHLYDLAKRRFGKNKNLIGTPETNPQSLAFISDDYHMKHYYAGGIQGGETMTYLDVCTKLAERIRTDLNGNVKAVHNDESHWNWYLTCSNKVHVVHLNHSYLYPERCLPAYKNENPHLQEYECAKLIQTKIPPIMIPLEKTSDFHQA